MNKLVRYLRIYEIKGAIKEGNEKNTHTHTRQQQQQQQTTKKITLKFSFFKIRMYTNLTLKIVFSRRETRYFHAENLPKFLVLQTFLRKKSLCIIF